MYMVLLLMMEMQRLGPLSKQKLRSKLDRHDFINGSQLDITIIS